ncbi:MAG: (2Fe-2S) ferredoxin domain-containing protein, partial [Clostridia bacterium]|nr:(2Fe-2S) ferredoxin domain-containing protein [Clostridia bacterium]
MAEHINNIQDLQKIKSEYQAKMEGFKYQVLVCGGAGCVSSNCAETQKALRENLARVGMTDEV